MEIKSFPAAGINHPVVHVPSYRKMSVSTEEYELVLAYRKHSLEVRKSAYHYLIDRVV